MSSSGDLVCSRCEQPVQEGTAFCLHCGTPFSDALRCMEHPHEPAAGVCLACRRPCCRACGKHAGDAFLCTRHASYESYEGMARVFGSTDVLQAEHTSGVLEQAGLHPFVFSRARYPRPDVSSFFSFPQVYERTIPEQKVLVPFAEIQEAERVLGELGILNGGNERLA
jgi:hypothetical protein